MNRAALTLRNLLAVPSNWDIPRIITVVEYLLDAGAVPPFGLNRETDLRTLQGNGSETAMLLHMIFDPELYPNYDSMRRPGPSVQNHLIELARQVHATLFPESNTHHRPLKSTIHYEVLLVPAPSNRALVDALRALVNLHSYWDVYFIGRVIQKMLDTPGAPHELPFGLDLDVDLLVLRSSTGINLGLIRALVDPTLDVNTAPPPSPTNEMPLTPLQLAMVCHPAILPLLLHIRKDIDKTLRDANGETPMQFALENEQQDITLALLHAGCSIPQNLSPNAIRFYEDQIARPLRIEALASMPSQRHRADGLVFPTGPHRGEEA